MRRIRERMTYANVVSTLALFLVLCGGVAYAARVPKKSVGPSQLKANAVTTAKIKANAVTTRKIKRNAITNVKIHDNAIESSKIQPGAIDGSKIQTGAVDTTKIADGTVTAGDLNTATMPFSRIVFEARGNTTVQLENGKPALYPLSNPTYTQEAGRDDEVMGALDVTFKPTCIKPRQVQVYVQADAAKPTELTTLNDVVATGQLSDETGGVTGGRVKIGPSGGLFQPVSATSHTLSLVAILHCSSGDGGTATFGAADVIGTKK